LALLSWLLRNRLPVCSFWRYSCSPAFKGEVKGHLELRISHC
jgi:hypothetical protein